MELAVNSGPAEARNAGVRSSRGEWLTFLDDDDTMFPEKVEHQLGLADRDQPKKMISCRTVYRHDGQDDVWPQRPLQANEDVADYILLRPSLLGRPGVISIQTLLVHRSLLDAVPFTTHSDHEDWAWLLEVWHLAGARVEFAWEPLVVYNIVTESISRSRRVNWRDSLRWAEQYRSWLRDHAFTSFLATKVALKAKRAGDGKGLREVAGPGASQQTSYAGRPVSPGHCAVAEIRSSRRLETFAFGRFGLISFCSFLSFMAFNQSGSLSSRSSSSCHEKRCGTIRLFR